MSLSTKVVFAVPPVSLTHIDVEPCHSVKLPLQETPNYLYIVVSLQFASKFWSSVLQTKTVDANVKCHYFAGLHTSREERGFCHNFRDLFPENDQVAVLQTQIFGEAAIHWSQQSDDRILAACLDHLSSLFLSLSHSARCDNTLMPIWSDVMRWGEAYSKPVTCEVQPDFVDRIGFVGEAQSWDHPMSMAGAYLSGLLEAGRIADLSARKDSE